ncbi:hypothetical protein JAAARDRAFT_206173 [Jaapia argillacea MUCL 33604]|uniref:Uncharacterized protein n=1 Tax=Jaapia argillacea MUCL 33604 TaxID=933084 RepID=A0A067PWZ2_9AGAM|nr:hypothetical protein JAAARDRAFT_206173 [Jaapia argillacea MUCL 33604]
MKFLSTTFAVASLVAGALAQLTINTPASVVECEPVLLSWTSGTPPYYLSILPGGQPSAAPLYQFPQQTGTSVTWVVNIASGTSIGLTLRDSTGTTAQSAPFTIIPGTSTSCLNSNATTTTGAGSTTAGSPSSSAAGSTTGTSTTPGSSTSTPGTSPTLLGTTTHAATTGTTPASTTHTTAPASSTTAASGASSSFLVQGGVVAVVGAAVAALLV